jgi:hypothetical protein
VSQPLALLWKLTSRLRLTRSARMTQLGSALGTDKRVVKSFCCLLTDLRQFDILQSGPGLLAGTECNLIK